jgi:hypothetical protein
MAKNKNKQRSNKNVQSGTITEAARSGTAVTLTHQSIAERAWSIWQSSGCSPGQDEQNWLEAEAQLKQELSVN